MSMRNWIGCVLASVSMAASAQDAVIHVTEQGGGDGTSWQSPTTLQSALSGGSGSEIWVKMGTYKPTSGTDRDVSFNIPNGTGLYGGFYGNENARSQRNPATNVTTLSGDIDGDDLLDAQNSYRVISASGLTSGTIDGFTITMGYGDGGSKNDGAALMVHNCAAFTVANCRFTSNFAVNWGGALFIHQHTSGPGTTDITVTNCDFDHNTCNDAGGAMAYLNQHGAGHDLTIYDCDFSDNEIIDTNSGMADGGALEVNGPDEVTIELCEFIDNTAENYGGAMRIISDGSTVNSATIENCLFQGNQALEHDGGAVYVADVEQAIFDGCDFINNQSELGGGGLWVLTQPTNTSPSRTNDVDLTDCTFIGNNMVDTDDSFAAGGGVWYTGNSGVPATYPGILTGKWTNCKFIGNDGIRGGGAYLTSTGRVDIESCEFIGNTTDKAGGGIGIGDPQAVNLGDTQSIRIWKSLFVSNTSTKGGAIHNHEGSITYMVNCILAGNSSTEEGGAVFNSKHEEELELPAKLYMHNCIIAGNVASGSNDFDMGGGVFSGLSGDEAFADLRHCTIAGNYAGYKYGGAVNAGAGDDSDMIARNCIFWENADADGGTDAVAAQLHYTHALAADDVDNNIVDNLQSQDGRYNSLGGSEVNKGDDPVFADTTTTATWSASTPNATAGTVTFTVASIAGNANPSDLFFKPDESPYQLLVKEIVEDTSIVCWGWWPLLTSQNETGAIIDYHIDSSGGADDYGDTNHVPPDKCDLNGNSNITEALPYDLEPTNARNQSTAPDCGPYEIPN